MDPLVGGLISGGANLLGSIFSANTSAQNTQAQIAASESEQQTANQFTEQMSNTAYQRATADMKAAGLNPMMMFGSGSAASTPSASSIQAPMPQTQSAMAGFGKAVDSGLSAAVTAKTMDKMTDEIANLKAEVTQRDADSRLKGVQAGETAQRAGLENAETRQKIASLPEATLHGKSAQDILSLPDSVRRAGNVLGWGGNKASDVLAPVLNSASVARRFMSPSSFY